MKHVQANHVAMFKENRLILFLLLVDSKTTKKRQVGQYGRRKRVWQHTDKSRFPAKRTSHKIGMLHGMRAIS
jgi:hypothetical protein